MIRRQPLIARCHMRMAIMLLAWMETHMVVTALDNGVGLTPPMGWISWQRYGCEVDCVNNPDSCINANLYITQAQKLVLDGYKEVGYIYVNVDDCWSQVDRDEHGNIVDDTIRFPGGMSFLSQQIHELGLKFGLYTDIGTQTCAKYPGLQDHMEQDIYKFVHEYQIDALKVDGCNADPETFPVTFPKLSEIMNVTASETNRPILLNCIWPLASKNHGEDQLQNIAKYCNYWRNYYDVWDEWATVRNIIDYFTRNSTSDPLIAVAGPGQYNDPDMLLMGNPGLSISEQYIQFGLWCILAAPLFISADLYKMPVESQRILLNRDMIAINQDPLGKSGYCAEACNSHQRIYIKELTSSTTSTTMYDNSTNQTLSYTSNSWAIALVNFNSYFGYVPITFDYKKHIPSSVLASNHTTTTKELEQRSASGFVARDVMEQRDLPDVFSETLTVLVDESSMKMFRITLVP